MNAIISCAKLKIHASAHCGDSQHAHDVTAPCQLNSIDLTSIAQFPILNSVILSSVYEAMPALKADAEVKLRCFGTAKQ
jgi:hypothetical protein